MPRTKTKYCWFHGGEHPLSEFGPNRSRSDGLQLICREAMREYQRDYRRRNRERVASYNKRYYGGFRERILAAYGGACSCCGEDISEFLTIEHRGGIVPEHHRYANGRRIGGVNLYKVILEEGCPDEYCLLCWNCNCARGAFGECPHEAQRRREQIRAVDD